TMARFRKYSTIWSSARRPASQTRYTDARYAAMTTAMTPPRIEVGLIQLLHGSPATPPAGMRPEAIAPTTAPIQNGTITDADANAAPKLRFELVFVTVLRNANPAPRSTIPSAAIVSGTNTVSVIDAYASGKHVHRTTHVKISHTWLASHTGPIACSITDRGRAPRSAPPAIRSQKPAPKSAPPNTAYAMIPMNSTTAAAVLIRRSSRRGVATGAGRTARRHPH